LTGKRPGVSSIPDEKAHRFRLLRVDGKSLQISKSAPGAWGLPIGEDRIKFSIDALDAIAGMETTTETK
jgi:hypothetical protein